MSPEQSDRGNPPPLGHGVTEAEPRMPGEPERPGVPADQPNGRPAAATVTPALFHVALMGSVAEAAAAVAASLPGPGGSVVIGDGG